MDIQSDNRGINAVLRQFLVPSWAQVFLYVLVSLLLFGLFNVQSIWRDYNNALLLNPELLSGAVTDKGNGLSEIWNTLLHSSLLQVVFWMTVGALTYLFIWFVRSVSTNLRNDIIADEYIHPASYNRKGYWESVIAHKILFGATVVVLFGYLYANLKLQPLLAQVGYSAIKDFEVIPSLIDLIGVILGTVILLHLLTLLFRVTANSWRFIYKDL